VIHNPWSTKQSSKRKRNLQKPKQKKTLEKIKSLCALA
jgi:hypothetical protein